MKDWCVFDTAPKVITQTIKISIKSYREFKSYMKKKENKISFVEFRVLQSLNKETLDRDKFS